MLVKKRDPDSVSSHPSSYNGSTSLQAVGSLGSISIPTSSTPTSSTTVSTSPKNQQV